MAHEFESGITFGEKSWHGLETNLETNSTIRRSVSDCLQQSGMDWRVVKLPLQVSTVAGLHPDIAGMPIESCALFRDSDWSHLGTVGTQYQPLQNSEIFGWFQPWLDSGLIQFESCASLKAGRVVYVQASLEMPNLEIQTNDSVKPFLLISSSHDGSQATKVGFCPIRVVCANTLRMAHDCGQLLSVRHTSSQKLALERIRDIVDVAKGKFEATAEQYRRLAAVGIDRAQLREYVAVIMDAPAPELRSTRLQNQIDKIVELAQIGRGNSPDHLTLWQAYQGVTEWLEHYRTKSADSRKHAVLFGSSIVTNQRALDYALELVA